MVLPFKENLQKQNQQLIWGITQDGGTGLPVGASPAHSLHHVRDEAVRDAWTGLLGQIKGVFQLLDGSYSSSARSPLLLQLQELEHHI